MYDMKRILNVFGGLNMIFQESERIELKKIVVDEIKKEIIAFANCDGGVVYIGIEDNGTVVGIDNIDETISQVSNMARDTIKPDITMFIHYDSIIVDNHKIVVINIQRGTNRPYYLAKKGLRPEGVYVRQGTSSVPATDIAIRQMIKETDGDSFEKSRSLNQELTFTEAQKEFKMRNISFASAQKQTLKLLTKDNMYTNLGLLLSDQCIHTIKVAVFQGNDQGIFKDRREFSGSIMKQLRDVYEYICFHNNTHSTFDNLFRIDTKDYPEIAIRESLLNLIVHRDYSFSSSSFINIYDDRIEFISIGGLVNGISLDDVLLGISVCRNTELANIFYRLELIEAYGTGIQKILSSYKGQIVKPSIKTTTNAFKIILPNTNSLSSMGNNDFFLMEEAPSIYENKLSPSKEHSSEEEIVLSYLKKNHYITREAVEKIFGVSTTTAYRILKNLLNKNLISKQGRGKNTKYFISK